MDQACLVFPFSKTNANAISALLASLDIHPTLKDLPVYLPLLKEEPQVVFEQINQYKQVIVAFSLFSTQYRLVATRIQQYHTILRDRPHIIICGGPHAIGDPMSLLIQGADVICTGEGEVTFGEIILSFLKGTDTHQIKGIAYMEGKTMQRTQRADPVDLDAFPPFSIRHHLYRPIEITRGCAWKCRFCQIRSKGIPVKHRSIATIVKYVKIINEQFADRRTDIRFISPNALSYGSTNGKDVDLEVVEAMLKAVRAIIGREAHIYFGSFPSEVRPETITKESVMVLKQYTNAKKIVLGGQSGSDRILSIANRGHTAAETERATALLIDAGFAVDVDIIFGLPEENADDIQLTIDHMNTLTNVGANIHSHTFMPLVGTPFASQPAGTVEPAYGKAIQLLQDKHKISGHHARQEQLAQEMEARRNRHKATQK